MSNAADKFQEMAALALFNYGNVHMSRARKRAYHTEDASREAILSHIKDLYEWAQTEYSKAAESSFNTCKLFSILIVSPSSKFPKVPLMN